MNRSTTLAAAAALAALVAGGAAAQEFWVQIEAHPTLSETTRQAERYAAAIAEVAAYDQRGAWNVIAIGPFDEATARDRLRALRRAGAIPADSFVSRGATYGTRIWEASRTTTPASAPDRPVGVLSALALPPAVDLAPAATLSDAARPYVETPEQARRSEAALDRPAREDLQRALQWFGLYDASIDGAFGRGTRASMAAWQEREGLEATGILTSRQRKALLAAWDAERARIGIARLRVEEAGIALDAPMGLVRLDRIEAPFVHYDGRDGSGVRLSLISQPGDRAALGGLYQILQTLDIVPEDGPRELDGDRFSITGIAEGRTTQAEARLDGDHVVGFLLSWPPAQDGAIARILPDMTASVASVGAPLDPEAGFDAAAQAPDMVSGFELRRPLRAASGFWADRSGAVLTAAATVDGCARVTVDGAEASVALARDGVAVLRPEARLAPPAVALLAPTEARLRTDVTLGGYPFGGVLGAATTTRGTLADVRGLDGAADVLRLALAAAEGDAGGPVLDEAGRVAGLLLPAEDGARALPADVALAYKAAGLAGLMAEAGVEATLSEDGFAIPPVALARRAADLTVLVGCWG